MKRLFLFVAVATLGLTSCSSDDDKGGNGGSTTSELKVKVNGFEKTFNSIAVQVDDFEELFGYTELTIIASHSASERIIFTAYKGDVEGGIWNIEYIKDGEVYWENQSSMSQELEINNGSRLKGTFTGFLYGNNEDVYLTDGSFDISY